MTTAIDSRLEKSAGLRNIIASAAIAWFCFTESFLGMELHEMGFHLHNAPPREASLQMDLDERSW